MPAPSDRRLSLILAFGFGVVFMAVLLAFVFAVPNPTNQQFEVIRIVLALAVGHVAAMIPGFLNVHLQAGANLALRAGGALAVFAVVYFYSPARWVTDTACLTTQTSGDRPRRQLSAIAGCGNPVSGGASPP